MCSHEHVFRLCISCVHHLLIAICVVMRHCDMQVHLQLTDRPDEMIVWWITSDNVKSVVEFRNDNYTWSDVTNWNGPQKYERADNIHGEYKSGTCFQKIGCFPSAAC